MSSNDTAGVDDGRTANGDADLLDDAKDDPNEISISSEQPNDSSDPNEISIGDDIDTPIKQSPEVTTTNMDDNDISNDLPTNDTEEEEIFSTPNNSPDNTSNTHKPSIATVSAIVNEVLRQKESSDSVDIAKIASTEVQKFYDDGRDQIEEGTKPPPPTSQHNNSQWNMSVNETRALFGSKGTKGASAILSSKIKAALSINKSNNNNTNTLSAADRMEMAMQNPDILNENNPDFNNLCSELGITPDSHPQLHSPYTYQLYNKRKCRQCCTMALLVVSLVVIITHVTTRGFSQHANKKPGDHIVLGNNKDLSTDDNLDQLYYTLSDTYLPMWYDRSMGWKGSTYSEAVTFCNAHDNFVPCPYNVYCPGEGGHLIFNEVFENENGLSWAPTKEENMWVQVGNGGEQCTRKKSPGVHRKDLTRHIMCCLAEPLSDDETSHVPKPPNVEEEHGEGVEDPILPPPSMAGAGMDAGNAYNDNEAAEMVDEVIEKSEEGQDINVAASQNPMQGVPQGFEPLNSLPHAAGEHDFQADDTIVAMEIALHPKWHNFADGWSGGSYYDALQYCYEKEQELCPSAAVCPQGPTLPPYAGFTTVSDGDSSTQWVPVINHSNQWVLVDTKDNNGSQCMDYQSLNGNQSPSWGLDGSEPGLKQNVLCCARTTPLPHVNTEAAKTEVHQHPEDRPTTSQTADALPNAKEEMEKDDKETVEGIWFSISNGWNAGSASDARHFCSMPENEINNIRLKLCPFSFYCPNGPTHEPASGREVVHDSTEAEQWAPTFDGDWVLIGLFGPNRNTQCLTHKQLMGEKPSWGQDSTNKEKKQFVMCCPDHST